MLSSGTAAYINEYIVDGYFKGKKFCNSVSGMPLKVQSCARERSGDVICTYLIEVTDEALENMITVEYFETLQYIIILNVSQSTCLLSNKFISILGKPFYSIFICELSLQDERALEIEKQLKTSGQYVLASKTLLLAYNSDMNSVFKALKLNPSITTVTLIKCTISASEFKMVFSARFKHLRKISFPQCSIGHRSSRDIFLYNPIFCTGVGMSYLKQLDLSSCESLHANRIIISLQSCITEKIILFYQIAGLIISLFMLSLSMHIMEEI